MPYISHCILPEEDGSTVKQVLRQRFALSSSLLIKCKREADGILLNGLEVHVSAEVHTGDTLAFSIADEAAGNGIEAVYIKLNIVYEDDYLLVLDKPAGIAVIPPSLGADRASISAAYAYHYPHLCFHAVNRLDKGTSGLMVVAKYGYIHERLQNSLHNNFLREYLGIAVGRVTPPAGCIDTPIARAEGSAILRCVSPVGSPALTEYESLENTDDFTLLRLLPHTGRTHQLRVHLSSLGFPLAGDHLYGTEDKTLISRPALHSHALSFTHPVTGRRLRFTSPLPEDMKKLLQ